MEAFSLLRYWRSNGGDGSSNATVSTSTAITTTTTIVTGVNSPASETEDEKDDEDDHGPFIDLEFSLPAGEAEELNKTDEIENGSDYGEEDENDDEEDSDGSDELKFTVLSGSSGDSTGDVNVSVSPSDDLFFRGSFAPVEQMPEINSTPPEFRLSLKKSATKFRVMMLKFRKSKSKDDSIECTDSNASSSSNSKEEHKRDQTGESTDSGKSMTVKFNRHDSSKASKKQQNDDEPVSGSSDEKKSPTETMQRYFRKVKPLYIRVSKKYGEKMKFTGQRTFPVATKPNSAQSSEEQKHSTAEASEPPLLPINSNRLKQGNLPAGLRVVCKHLRKTWSASTPVAVAAAPPVTISSNRLDDSLLQQQDGIQSAILHCKRSFKASRDSVPAPASDQRENSSSSDEAEDIHKR